MNDDALRARIRQAVAALETGLDDAPPRPVVPRRGPRTRRRTVAALVTVAVLAVGASTTWLATRTGDDAGQVATGDSAEGTEGATGDDHAVTALPEDGWRRIDLGDATWRDGAAVVALAEGRVVIAGGRDATEPGSFLTDVVDPEAGRSTRSDPVAVRDPAVAAVRRTGGAVDVLVSSGEVVGLGPDAAEPRVLAAGTAGRPTAETSPASVAGGSDLVDLAAGTRWDPAGRSWVPISPPPSPIESGYLRASVAAGSHVVVAGFQAPTLLYSVADDTWRELDTPPLPPDAEHVGQPALAVAGGRAYLVDEYGSGAVLTLADGSWASLEVPATTRQGDACLPVAASTSDRAIFGFCTQLLIVDDAGHWQTLPTPDPAPAQGLAADHDHLLLLTADSGAPARDTTSKTTLWAYPL